MSKTENAGQGQASGMKSDAQYEKEREQRNADILNKLKNGELKGQVTVILVLGSAGAGKTNLVKLLTQKDIRIGHSLESGTVAALNILTEINGKWFLFIDTPGFGHPDMPTSKVKKIIHSMVGYFTRQLGGIHGILYVHSILTERTSQGMRDSYEFLEKITDKKVNGVTFITTNWDGFPEKHRAKCENRANALIDKEWKSFRVREPDGCKYFISGVSCDEDSDSDKKKQRKLLVEQVLGSFGRSGVRSLEMPFWEWTKGEKAQAVFSVTCLVLTTPIWAPVLLIKEVVKNSEVSFGVEISF